MTSLISNPKTYKPGSEMEFCGPLRPPYSKGIWVGDNPLQNPFLSMLAQTLLIVITSRVLYFFLRPLGQTKLVCSLLVCFPYLSFFPWVASNPFDEMPKVPQRADL